jgi:hypothetical protein
MDEDARVFLDHLAVGRHGMREPHVAADRAVVPNPSAASQNRSVGIYRHMIFQIWVPLVLDERPGAGTETQPASAA